MTELQPTTARWCLFGDRDPEQELAHAMERRGVAGAVKPAVRGLGHAGQDAVDREAAHATAGILDVDLATVVVRGLKASAEVRSAARRTYLDGSAASVVVATERITSTYPWCVALEVDGTEVSRLRVTLALAVVLKGLAVTVRHGELVSVGSDRCTVTASLTLQDVEVAHRSRDIVLPLELALAHPVALLTAAERAELDATPRPAVTPPG